MGVGAPLELSGVWYMRGNIAPDELFSLARGWYDENSGLYKVRVYDENIWTFDPTSDGRVLYNDVRVFGLTYGVFADPSSSNFNFIAEFHLPSFLTGQKIVLGPNMVNFSVIPQAGDPNRYTRTSYDIFGKAYPTYE
ncbi:hypothetical protein HDU76_009025, partial [Blyttiomyces sp. JEL0837]